MGGDSVHNSAATTKVCSRCQQELPLVDFNLNDATKDGRYTYCRACQHPAAQADHAIPAGALERPVKPITKPAVIPQDILNGIKVPPTVEKLCEGFWKWYSPKGWCIAALHYSADPRKRPGTPEGDAWVTNLKKKTSNRDWRREYDIDFTISEGEPFFGGFNRKIHVQPLEYDSSLVLVRSWDFGKGHPAIVFGQLDPKNKLKVLYSKIETNKDIFHFAPWVLAETNARFPGARIVDYCDPSGAQETDKGATTAILLQQFGIKLHYRFTFLEYGLRMMEQRLLVTADGLPGILIDPINVDMIAGFDGGYKLDTNATGKDSEGKLKNTPKKDGWYDHVMDALRYMFVGLFLIEADSQVGEEEAWRKLGLWRTNKQHQAREDKSNPMEDFLT